MPDCGVNKTLGIPPMDVAALKRTVWVTPDRFLLESLILAQDERWRRA